MKHSLVKRDFFPATYNFKNLFEDVLDTPFLNDYCWSKLPAMPRTDIVKGDNATIIKMEVPGLKESDIKIEYENGVLTVSSEKSKKDESSTDKYIRREIRSSAFTRSWTLNEADVDWDKNVSSVLKNGILEIAVPFKTPVKQDPKKITIKTE